jgi:heme/copper-type cytochrome/quinol oxidase subunit 3
MALTTPASATPVAPEAVDPGPSRPWSPPRGTTMLGTSLLLAAEGMLLGAVIATYFTIKAGAPLWPPSGVHLNTYIPTVVTITLAMAACSVGWMLFAIRRNDQRNGFIAAVLSAVLGLAIANGEWYWITRAGFGVGKHAYGALFHVLAGLHMLHVAAGVVMLLVMAGQTLAGHFSREDYEPVRATAYFWQFGNVVWLAVLCALFFFASHHQ